MVKMTVNMYPPTNGMKHLPDIKTKRQGIKMIKTWKRHIMNLIIKTKREKNYIEKET